MIRKLLKLANVVGWVSLAVVYWAGWYQPPWWIIGFALTVVALDLLTAFLREEISSTVERVPHDS